LWISVLNTYTKSKQTGAAEMAESLLSRLEAESRSGKNKMMKPDTISYSTCIGAWAKSSASDKFDRAESLMERMIQQCTKDSQSGEPTLVKPNVATWNGLLSVLVSSNLPRGPKKGQLILERMHKMGIVPNQISYVSLLRICSRAHYSKSSVEDQKEALEIALITFDRMRSNGCVVDSMTYLTLIQICDNLIIGTETRNRVIIGLFHKCCQDGQVNEEVISRFQHVLSKKLFSSLLSQVLPNDTAESFNIRDLPRQWTEGTHTPAKFTRTN
jgi:hypothetical protein